MEQSAIVECMQTMCEQHYGVRMKSEEVEQILKISQIRVFPKGEMIQGIRETITHVGIVLKGIVRSYYLDAEGNEMTKHFLKEGCFVMDESLLGYEQSIAAIEALEDTTILLMEFKQLKELIRVHETFKNFYIATLEKGMRYKIYRESEFLAKNATERYLQFCKDYPELVSRVKQSYISTYLGITPESLSRIRKTLKEGV